MTSYRFVRKYPFVSGISILMILLYIFLPSVFFPLVYSSPFIALASVILRVYLKYKRLKSQNAKEVEKRKHETNSNRSESSKDDIIILRNDGTAISRQMSRRRNFKDRNRLEWDAQAGTERKDVVPSATSDNDLIGRSLQIEVNKSLSSDQKEGSAAEKVPVSESSSKPDFTSDSASLERDEQSHKFDGNGGEVEAESMEEAEDDDEEEAQDDRNKAVEWTEDDQKNLMDLGISEIERNKRLETLIAKRRARKLMRMQAGKSLIDIDMDNVPSPEIEIAPILVSRNNPFDRPSDPNEDSRMPGSAPPVLLPLRNPFDLPYDPLEEKPNLMGDSFHEEFTATQQRDMLFCRHESFTMGPFSPLEPKQDQQDSVFGPYFGTAYRESEGLGYLRYRRPANKGDHDRLVEQLLCLERKPMSHDLSVQDLVEGDRASNEEIKSVELQHEEGKETDHSTTQSQGEGIEDAQNINSGLGKQSQAQMETDTTEVNDGESNASSSSDEDDIFNANIAGVAVSLTSKGRNFPKVLHPVQNSLVCSIPRNIAGKVLSYDSSPSAEDKANRLFFEERRHCHTPTYSIASDMQVEVSEVGSPPSMVNESFTYDGDNEKGISSGSEDMWGASPRVGGLEEKQSSSGEEQNVGDEGSTEAGFLGANKSSVDPIASSVQSEPLNQQQLTNTRLLSPSRTEIPEKGQANLMDSDYETHDKENQAAEDIGDSRSSKLSLECLEAEHLIERLRAHPSLEVHSEKLEEPSNLNEKPREEASAIYDVNDQIVHSNDELENLKSIDDKDDEARALIKQEDMMDPSKRCEETNSEYIDGNSEKQSADKGTSDMSEAIHERNKLNSTEEEEKQRNIEVGSSGVNQNSGDHDASIVLPELAVEQVYNNSSASSSPTSVLLEEDPLDQASSSSSEPKLQTDLSLHDVEDTAKSDLSNQKPPEKDLIAHSSNNTDLENSQEKSNPPGWSPEDANKLMTDGKTDKEISRSVEASKGESDILINRDPAEESDSKVIEDAEGVSQNLAEEKYNADNPGTLPTDQEAAHHPHKSNENANINSSNDLAVCEKEDKKSQTVEDGGGESICIRQEAAIMPPELPEATSSRNIEDIHGKSIKLSGDEAIGSPSKSFEENGNPSFMEDNEDLTKVIEHEDTKQPSEPAEAERTFEGTKDAQGDSTSVSESEATADPSKSIEENGNPSFMEDNQCLTKVIEHEDTKQPSEPAEAETKFEATKDAQADSTNASESEGTADTSKLIEENGNPSSMEDNEDLTKVIEHEDTKHPSKPAEAETKFEATKDAQGDSTNVSESKAAADSSNQAIGSIKSDTYPTSVGESSTASSDIIRNVNETLMSEIMNEAKVESVGQSEVESQASIRQEPVPELLKTVEESNSRSTGDIEGESKSSSEATQSVKDEPKGLIKDSTEVDNPVNHELITEVPKPTGSEVIDSKPEVNGGHLET